MADARWIVATVLAAYGAGLSTYNIYIQRKQSKRQIVVTVGFVIPTYGNRLGNTNLSITASNSGHRPVTLTSAGFRLPRENKIMWIPDLGGTVRLPHHLTEGTSCSQWVSVRIVKEQLRELGYSGKVPLIGFSSVPTLVALEAVSH